MKSTALALFCALLTAAPCVAGTTGVLHGYVREEHGRPIANALVIAVSHGQEARTYTNAQGFFSFVSLAPDQYIVEAEKAGESGAFTIAARVSSDQFTTLDLHFRDYRHCKAFTPVTVAAYQQTAAFESLDVQRTQTYPPYVAPLLLNPQAPTRIAAYCL